MAEFFIQLAQRLAGGNDILAVILLSVMPFFEVRGAIPFALSVGLTYFDALLISVAASTVAIPLAILIFAPIVKALKKISLTKKLTLSVEGYISQKAEKLFSSRIKVGPLEHTIENPVIKLKDKLKQTKNPFKKLKYLIKGNPKTQQQALNTKQGFFYKPLLLFAALPIPLTGIWTGAAITAIAKLNKPKAFLSLAVGNLISALILIGFTYLFADALAIIINVFIAIIIIGIFYKIIKIVVKKPETRI